MAFNTSLSTSKHFYLQNYRLDLIWLRQHANVCVILWIRGLLQCWHWWCTSTTQWLSTWSILAPGWIFYGFLVLFAASSASSGFWLFLAWFSSYVRRRCLHRYWFHTCFALSAKVMDFCVWWRSLSVAPGWGDTSFRYYIKPFGYSRIQVYKNQAVPSTLAIDLCART